MNRYLIAVIACLLLAGCPGPVERTLSKVQPPKTVRVVVEKPRDLPDWATAPMDKPMPAATTVEATVKSHNARGAIIDYVNCRSALIRRIEKGEKIDRNTCSL